MRVLIVEDEPRLAENVARTLRESAGYAVDVASDGQEGLFLAESNAYDVVLLKLVGSTLKSCIRECDTLARWGVSGLWLIGLWERITAGPRRELPMDITQERGSAEPTPVG